MFDTPDLAWKDTAIIRTSINKLALMHCRACPKHILPGCSANPTMYQANTCWESQSIQGCLGLIAIAAQLMRSVHRPSSNLQHQRTLNAHLDDIGVSCCAGCVELPSQLHSLQHAFCNLCLQIGFLLPCCCQLCLQYQSDQFVSGLVCQDTIPKAESYCRQHPQYCKYSCVLRLVIFELGAQDQAGDKLYARLGKPCIRADGTGKAVRFVAKRTVPTPLHEPWTIAADADKSRAGAPINTRNQILGMAVSEVAWRRGARCTSSQRKQYGENC